MKYKDQIIRLLIPVMISLSLIVSACAAKKQQASENLRTELNLRYSIAPDQALNYRNLSETDQTINMMGQPVKSSTKTDFEYSIRGRGTDEQNNMLTEITINEINISESTIQGETNPDTSALTGKSFAVTFSPRGRELVFEGLNELPLISSGQPGDEGRSVEQYFMNILPDLPDKPVKAGDSWTGQRDSRVQQGPMEIVTKGKSYNSLEGFETVNGMKCVRIKTNEESSVEGTGNIMGNDIKVTGGINSTSTWYFAYEEGIFVRASVDQVLDLKIDMGTMGEMPQTAKTKMQVELIR